MARNWHQVSMDEARRNPLYGTKNWLAVFAFGILMAPLRELAELSSAAHAAGVGMSEMLALNDAVGAYAKAVLAFESLMAATILWLLFTKHRSFRPVASIFLLIWYPVLVAIALATEPPGVAGALGTMLIPWVMSCAIWVTYLQRSRRVRVTFENSVLVESNRLPVAPIVQRQIPESSSMSEYRQTHPLQPGKASPGPFPSAAAPPALAPVGQADQAEQFWAQALTEFEGSSRRQGLWARAFAEADGNEAIAKARYLRERGHQIAEEAQKIQDDQAAKVADAQRGAAELVGRIGKIRNEFMSGAAWPLEHLGDLVRAVEIDPSLTTLADRTYGRTLLHWCAKYNLAREASVLLQRGANADAPDGNGRRPHELAENLELRGILRTAATSRQVAAAPR